jgi:hypothetical protein
VPEDRWADMVATGKVSPAEDPADLVDEPPVDYGIDASAMLAAIRAEER